MQKITLLILLIWTSLVQAQDTAKADAITNAATVYFGYGAELTQQANIRISNATKYIIISQLSTTVDINSLQVSCPEDVTLLSQRFSVFYPVAATRPKTNEILKLEDSIEMLRKEISRIENNNDIEQETMNKTGSLIETAMSGNGNKTVLSADVLKLIEYYNARIERAKTNIYNNKQSIKKLNQQISRVNERIAELNNQPVTKQKPYGQLILQVMSKRNGSLPVSISYYTRNAGWTPMYDIRVNSKNNKVKLVYKASLTQTTGIDWKNTKLTLSTGTPNFGVEAPLLNPWYLQLYVPALYNSLQGRVAGVNVTNTIPGYYDDKQLKEVVVTTGNGIERQKRDLGYSAPTIDPSTLQTYTKLTEGQLNTNFEIDLPYDIDSDGQLHTVSIKDEEINCILKNYAVPKLERDAYLLAEITDWQNLDLLPGNANIIMDDTYIGKSLIDPNTTADTLNLSLGRDKRVAIKRSLLKELSSLKPSAGANRQSFTYEIIVKNNKLTDVNLILKDQYPLSSIKEVEVKLEDSGDATVNEENGVLTWKLSLKPGESRKIRFSFLVKYPKDKKIINLK